MIAMAQHPAAPLVASICPVVEDDTNGRTWVSLRDIVITGTESGWYHFEILGYSPDASGGAGESWGTIKPLRGEDGIMIDLDALSVRRGLEAWISDRLTRGWPLHEILECLDESVMDASQADSILQFIVYQEDRFS